MIPLWRETGYRFDFDEARRVERIHLQGARPGDWVELFRNPHSPESPAIVSGIVEEGGWVRLETALVTAVGDRFVAFLTPSEPIPIGPLPTRLLSSLPREIA